MSSDPFRVLRRVERGHGPEVGPPDEAHSVERQVAAQGIEVAELVVHPDK